VKTGIVVAVLGLTLQPAMASAQTAVPPSATDQRRYDGMSILEGTLTGAVRSAASKIAKDLQSNTPNAMLFTGEARAKGFTLDGYGVFFYVEIPAVNLELTFMVESIERDAQRRLELPSAAAPGTVNSRRELPSPSNPKETLQNLASDDPAQRWRDTVKLALVDAMLEHSKSLELKPDEWLSVAARGSEGGLLPNEIYQLTTIVLRVKGSDLSDYLAGRLTKDEARLKVEVRQF
jgi:hypothetical protein